MLPTPVAGVFSDRFGRKTILVPNVWALLAATVVFGVARSLNLPNAFSFLTAATPKENRGAFFSLNSTILRLGHTVARYS